MDTPADKPAVPDPQAATIRSPSLSTGQVLGKRYRLIELLGRGGMGEVWKAYDLKLRVEVALKSVRRDLFSSEQALEILRQEVRSAREVVSPAVCRLFDLVEVDGSELVSMEYIEGRTLLEVLQEDGPLGLREASEVASQFLSGLEAIHQAGLVHRDIKPENIMISRAGRVVIMDFGIARPQQVEGGTVSGTPAYMAPEQSRGEAVDARADVFSAGIVLAEMVAGEGIQERESRETIWKGAHHSPPRLPESPWSPVLTKAVAHDTEQRYASAHALIRALEEVTLRVEGAENRRPYPGLASFSAADAEYFFGREMEIEAVWKKLPQAHLLALVGPSGAGKSSFVSAGLLPAMPEGWRALVFAPRNRPLKALAEGLLPEIGTDQESMRLLLDMEEPDTAVALFSRWRKQHEEVLLVVDQFEELFTQNPEEVQLSFAELLSRIALEADVHVLLSMRDDFLLRCHDHEKLAPIFSELTPLKAPAGPALRRAIVQPALKCGYRFEDEQLVDEMLDELSGERAALPLLAFAVASLWERRQVEGGLLTRSAYEEIGGVGGALAGHAEATLEKIGSDNIPIVREIFRNLITAEGTRAARDRDELLSVFEDEQAAERALQSLVDARLLTSFEQADQDIARIEIVHESLLKAWPRLVRWQAQDEEGSLLRDQLRQAAQLWEDRARSNDLLWTGSAFQEYQLWHERYAGGLTTAEKDFARAMTDLAERRKRRRRAAISASFVLLVVVLAVVGNFWRLSVAQTRRAEAETLRAESNELLTLGRQELEEDHTSALAYAIASLERVDSQKARRLALEALWKGPTKFIIPAEQYIWALDFSPDGRWMAGALSNGEVWVWSVEGGEPMVLKAHEKIAQKVSFHPERPWLVSAAQDTTNTVRVWSIPDGELVHALEFEAMTDAFWGDGGRTLLTSTVTEGGRSLWRSFSVDSWEETTLGTVGVFPGMMTRRVDPTGTRFLDGGGKQIRVFNFHQLGDPSRAEFEGRLEEMLYFASWDHTGGRVVTGDKNGDIRMWSISPDSAFSSRLIGRHPGSYEARFDLSGMRLASGSDEGTVRIWDLRAPPKADGLELLTVRSQVNDNPFSPDGRWMVSASGRRPRFWPLTRQYPLVLRGHAQAAARVVFDPEGRWLISSSRDDLRIWSLSPDSKVPDWIAGRANAYRISLDGKGKTLVLGGVDVLDLVDCASGEMTSLGTCSKDLKRTVAISPDGRIAACAGSWGFDDGLICLTEIDTGRSWTLGIGEGTRVEHLEFTPDGTLLSSSANDLRIWNLESGHPEVLMEEPVGRFDLSDDGTRILGHSGADVFVYDRRSGETTELIGHRGQHCLALNATGELVATGNTNTGEIRVGPPTDEEPHLLLRHPEGVNGLAFDPLGRWIASAGRDGTIMLWPIPTGTPLHTLPHEEFLERLYSLTNLRIVEDEESAGAYVYDLEPFPGWANAPTW